MHSYGSSSFVLVELVLSDLVWPVGRDSTAASLEPAALLRRDEKRSLDTAEVQPRWRWQESWQRASTQLRPQWSLGLGTLGTHSRLKMTFGIQGTASCEQRPSQAFYRAESHCMGQFEPDICLRECLFECVRHGLSEAAENAGILMDCQAPLKKLVFVELPGILVLGVELQLSVFAVFAPRRVRVEASCLDADKSSCWDHGST